jgi:hypothetical protein
MINNSEEIKKQLKELAPIVNSFTSETVQIKLVELLFQVKDEESPTDTFDQNKLKPKRKSKRKRSATGDKETANSSKGKKAGKRGPAALLTELIDEGYFNKKHSINDIVSFCSTNKATILKPNEFSTTLGRFVRDKRLNRETNKDGQYEYFKEK